MGNQYISTQPGQPTTPEQQANALGNLQLPQGTFYANTKAAADTLASSLPNGATVIVEADESAQPAGIRVRYTVSGGTLTSPILLGSSSAQFSPAAIATAVKRTIEDKFLDTVSIKDFGAIGDGNSHPLSSYFATLAAAQIVYPHAVSLSDQIDWAASQACLNYCASSKKACEIPDGIFIVNRPLTIKIHTPVVGVDMRTSVLKAHSSFSGSVLLQTDTDTSYWMQRCNISSITLDCNNYVGTGLKFWLATDVCVRSVAVEGATTIGIDVGDASAPASCIEIKLQRVYVRNYGTDTGKNSIGVLWNKVTDSSFHEGIIIGYAKGVKTSSTTASIVMFDVHPWNDSSNGPLIDCFHIDGSNNQLVCCYADTPTPRSDETITETHGFLIGGSCNVVIAPKMYVNSGVGVTDHTVGVKVTGDRCAVIGGSASVQGAMKFKQLIDMGPWARHNNLAGFTPPLGIAIVGGDSHLNYSVGHHRNTAIYAKSAASFGVYYQWTTEDAVNPMTVQQLAQTHGTPASRYAAIDVIDSDITGGKGTYKLMPFGGTILVGASSSTSYVGFFGASGVTQPKSASQAAVTGTAGATYGTAEQDTINATKTLVNQLRADLVSLGIIKGSA